MKTQAAILVEQKQPLVIDEIEIPCLTVGQVLVELTATRICGSQIGEIDGVRGADRWLPHLLGHEGCGRVLEIGLGVQWVKPGDRVVLHWRPGQGIQAPSPLYRWQGKNVNAGNITTFNRHAIISENRLTRIPDSVSDDIACLLADTLTTGFGIINNNARVKIGESVVVIGAGGIGLGVILGAHLAGAYPIIAADIVDAKLEIAKKYGATHCVNTKTAELNNAVKEICGCPFVDVCIDGTGNPKVIETAYALTAKHGRTILFGVMHHEHKVAIHTLPLHFGKILTGSEGGDSQPHLDIPRYIRMMQAKRFDPSGFVSHYGKLEDINTLIAQMRNGEVVHAIIRF